MYIVPIFLSSNESSIILHYFPIVKRAIHVKFEDKIRAKKKKCFQSVKINLPIVPSKIEGVI